MEIEDDTVDVEDSAGEVRNNAIPMTRNNPDRDRTIVLQSLDTPPTLRRENKKMCFEDKITAASALLLVMKGEECGCSYSSMETLPEVCAKADPDSYVWKKVTLSRNKNSYLVSHGLFKHFNKILKLNLFINKVQIVHAGLSLTCGPRKSDLVPASCLNFKLFNILMWCMMIF